MATQPILQDIPLPYPRNPEGFSQQGGHRVVGQLLANGNLFFQRITLTNPRYIFTLAWVFISDGDYDTIVTAYNDLIESPFSSNFTSPAGNTYTVTPMENTPPLEAVYTETPLGGLWNVTMRLREISNT